MPIVYIATNKINGKRYIGASKLTLDMRRREHFRGARNNGFCRVFYAAIRTLKPEYNITAGGRGVIGVPRTPEWAKKISNSLLGRKISSEHRERAIIGLNIGRAKRHRSVVCLNDGGFFPRIIDAAVHYKITEGGINAAARGAQTHTKGLSFVFSKSELSKDEREAALRQLQIKREVKRPSSHSKSVICSDGKIFNSITSAASYYNVSQALISRLCYKGGTTKNLQFRLYGNDYVKKKMRTKEEIENGVRLRNAALKRANETIKKRLICLDNNMLYESITEAAKANGLNISALSAAIYRSGKSGGKKFCFLEEWCPNPL